MSVFDRPDAAFTVLVNDDGRHSLWPAGLRVPSGWRVVHGEDNRESCLAYVEQHWRDRT
ncbi:MbtH family protein [Actinoplanes sp. NPDC049668]|uniref:MbtH family protein n=1 Tax=unclassified Actinoplanes TaxID=2626549 RepID=UPI0033B73A6C